MTSPTTEVAVQQAFEVANGIQVGTAQKNAQGTLKISFPQPFRGNPVVVVSGMYLLQANGVQHPDTIVNVNSADFTVSSDNASPNYYVNWVAYGPVS